ncbi:MAG: D-alanine--D-alanine ligase family protein [Bifidobacterium aquikefiri]|uniref:D-alanine--D-alanine ligase n=1 Tax=Bifidobacterium aquikefiri TaxID=1653207 RepID=A0A261G9Z7_9BIFI|nr:D-alanine--D-alanine ligase family protein [Bifidobacterium aquikefiri]OZG67806.1 D-alanine--D-alanine ligase [Bifidobacterium aquikefiri]
MAKKRIVVLYGGMADEHPISCISAASVLRAIDMERYEVIPVGITRKGQWIVDGEDPKAWKLGTSDLPSVEITKNSRPVLLDPALGCDGFFAGEHEDLKNPANGYGTNFVSMSGIDPEKHNVVCSLGHVDAVFPVLHGPFGEDGTVQGLFEMMKVPYVGCGVLASSVCMDKHFTKILLQAAGIDVAPWITLDTREFDSDSAFERNAMDILAQVQRAELAYPLFIKPSRAGSSFGVTKVESGDGADARSQLAGAVFEASRHDWKVLIEEGIDGREIECAVLRDVPAEQTRTSLPGEVVLDSRSHGDDDAFYDFDSKYMDESASHVEVPASLPQEILERVRTVAGKSFDAVDGMGLSRVDTFVRPDGSVMVNEINTMPGFTSISMYPKAWEATGIPYSKLITMLIDGVLSN